MASTDVIEPVRAHQFPRHPDDFYIEQDWIWDRLFEKPFMQDLGWVWDPCCGTGRAVEAATRAGHDAFGSDIHFRWEDPRVAALWGPPQGVYSSFQPLDFLELKAPTIAPAPGEEWGAIIGNPPFKKAMQFVQRALDYEPKVVAMLMPARWTHSDRRSEWLVKSRLSWVLPVVPRPSMPPGDYVLDGNKPENGKNDFSVFVWLRGWGHSPGMDWIRRDG